MPSMNIGTLVGYLTIDDKGVDKGTRSANQKIDKFAKDGERAGSQAGQKIGTATGQQLGKSAEQEIGKSESRIKSKIQQTFKRAVVGVGIAAGVAVGAAVFGGFKQAVNEQEARKVLGGLYGDANLAKETLKGLAEVSKTSPIDYSSYTTAAEQLAYAGVQGDDAIDILKNVGLAVVAAGGDSSNIDRASGALLKMVNAGKVTLDSIQQLSDAGIPIISGLADHFGVSMDQVNKMATNGQIKLDDVLSVMQNATGDTFQSMLVAGEQATQSFSNQWKIAKDNVTRAIGGALLPVIDSITPVIGKVADFMTDVLVPGIQTTVGWFGKLPGPVKAGATALGAYVALSKAGAFSAMARGVGRLTNAFTGLKGVRPAALLTKLGPAAAAGIAAAGIAMVVEQYRKAKQPIAEATSLIDANTGALLDNAKASLSSGFAEYRSTLEDLGLTAGQVADAIQNGGKQYDDLVKILSDAKHRLELSSSGPIESTLGWFGKGDAAKLSKVNELLGRITATRQDLTDAQWAATEADTAASVASGKASDGLDNYLNSLEIHRTDALASSAAEDAYAASLSTSAKMQEDSKSKAIDLAAANKKIPDTLGNMAKALDESADSASNANTKLKFFTISVDKLAGRDVPLEQATKLVNDQIRNLTDAFKDATKATDGHTKSLIKANGEIDTTTKAGSDLYDSVSDYREAYDTATTAASNHALAEGDAADALKAARKAADNTRKSFIEQATSAGLSKKEANKLADAMGILEGKKLTPKTLGLNADDKATGKVKDVNKEKLHDKTANLDAVDNASSKIDTVNRALDNMPRWITVGIRANDQVTPVVNSRTYGHYAEGGIISGGIPGKDSVPILAMPGEAVIPTAAVNANRALVESLIGSKQVIRPPARVGAVSPPSQSGQFTGNLYLDSGQLLGLVRGEIGAASSSQARAILAGVR